jgi:lysophospholipase L1-like esterase
MDGSAAYHELSLKYSSKPHWLRWLQGRYNRSISCIIREIFLLLKAIPLSLFARRIVGFWLICLALAGCGGSSKKVPAINWENPLPIAYGTPLSATQLDATASVPGSFNYNQTIGTVLSAGSQTLSVTFTPNDTANYATITASVAIFVVPLATPAISWSAPASITYGMPLSASQLNATETVPGSFAYSPSPGTVIPAGTQTLSVTFTPTALNHAVVQDSVFITVNQATPTLSWPAPAAITYGTQLSTAQLSATSTIPGRYAYSPAPGSLLATGPQTLTVLFTPFDTTDYTTASTSVALTVNQATPHITWSPKAWLAVGSPLGSGQLNATAIAPGSSALLSGSFVYSPPAGTIFNAAGPQSLSVTFTPSDTTDFTTAQTSISMTASVFGVVAWGDSLTHGNQGLDAGIYPDDLGQLITLPVVNEGISGNTTTEIGVREGGVSAPVTVDGGMIPDAGGVTVSFPTTNNGYNSWQPVTAEGPAEGVTGTILGVPGTVTIDSTGSILTFTRTNPGSQVSVFGTPPFVVDTPYAAYIPIFWEGRNNYLSTAQILSDLTAQVATVPAGQDYLVMSIINVNRPKEWPGGDEYQYLAAANNQMASTFGTHFLDIWRILVDSYNPALITDVSDYNHYSVPTSLRPISMNTSLATSIGTADTTIELQCGSCSIGSGTIMTIDPGGPKAENVFVSSTGTGEGVSVQRAIGGVDTSHDAGAPVVMTDPVHLNAQGYQIVANAVAQYLSAYLK